MILPSKNSKKTEGTEAIGRNTTVVVVDEFGELGNGPRRKSKFFGYAVSITRKASAFAGATLSNRRRFPGREVKAYEDTAEGRRKVLQEVSDIGADTRAYYVDKDRLPRGWGKKPRQGMDRLLHHAVEDSVPENGNVLVVVDHHSGHRDVEGFAESLSNEKRKVKGGQYNSASGPYSDLLQTHDYVAYATRDAVEFEKRSLTDILGTKFRKVTRWFYEK